MIQPVGNVHYKLGFTGLKPVRKVRKVLDIKEFIPEGLTEAGNKDGLDPLSMGLCSIPLATFGALQSIGKDTTVACNADFCDATTGYGALATTGVCVVQSVFS